VHSLSGGALYIFDSRGLHYCRYQSKELQKTLEGAASGTGEAVKTEPFTGEVPAGEGEDADAKEEVDARSVFVGSVSISLQL
jgi:hypothetical protein